MRRFIISVVSILAAASVILVSLTFLNIWRFRHSNFTLPSDIHTIVIGPSTTGHALNDDFIPNFKNVSRDGTPIEYIAYHLPKILEKNPQIDTVLLNHGRFQLRPDWHWNEQPQRMQNIRYLLPIAANKEFFYKERFNYNFYAAFLNPNPLLLKKHFLEYRFGYLSAVCYNVHKDKADWSIEWYNKKYKNSCYSEEYIKEAQASSKTQKYKETIEYCKKRNVVPVLVFTPVFEYDRWFDKKGFKEYMKTYDDDVLIADYEDFKFPDDTYYGDVHHLNSKGAEYFSKHIAKNGLKVVTLKEWLEE